MYNKLFAKIVDSSIWLEPDQTRIVWFMFIALMNEDGFVQFASVANVAYRARISKPKATEALKILESPDPNSSDDDNDGRRIERVPGGWIVLNAQKYRDLVTREMIREQTRVRVARKRAKDKAVTQCNAGVTQGNDQVTQSDTDTVSKAEANKRVGSNASRKRSHPTPIDEDFLNDLQKDPTYKGVNVHHVFGKMVRHCSLRGKQPTRRRLVDWLNREDVPMQSNGSTQQLTKYGTPVPSRCTMDKNGNVYDYTGRMMDVNQVRAALKKI